MSNRNPTLVGRIKVVTTPEVLKMGQCSACASAISRFVCLHYSTWSIMNAGVRVGDFSFLG